MSAPWYTPSGSPSTGSELSSSVVRSEFSSVETAMDKLPSFSGNANLPVYVNAGESGLEARSSGPYLFGSTTEIQVGAADPEVQTHITSRVNSVVQYSNNDTGAKILGAKTRSGTKGTIGTIVQNGDNILELIGYADDGVDFGTPVAGIYFRVNGTPGTNDMPGEIVFAVTPDGSATSTEYLVLDEDSLRVEDIPLDIREWSSGATGARARFYKSASTTVGTPGTVLSDDDDIMNISCYGDDGTDLATEAGYLTFRVNGTPGSNSMPSEFLVGINKGATSPIQAMRLYWDTTGSPDVGTTMELRTDTSGTTRGPALRLYKDDSSASDGDSLGRLEFVGNDTGGSEQLYGAIVCSASDASVGTEDGTIRFALVKAGLFVNELFVAFNGTFGVNATGSGQGAGTSNWKAVYDDGSGPLTDYVLDYAVDGYIDYDFYDHTLFGSDHARAWNPEYLNIDTYAKAWQKRCALPSFLSKSERFDVNGKETRIPIGQQVQSLVETVETYAVHILQLHQRIQELENV